MRRSLIILPFLLGVSCSRSGHIHDSLPDETFAALNASLLETAEAQREAGFGADRCRAGADSVLQHAGVTREQFAATIAALNEDPVRWRNVSETTVRILEERSGAQQERR